MQKENLEQKIGLMEKLRGVAKQTVGIYALTLALGGALGGCDIDDNDNDNYGSSSTGCSYTVGGNTGGNKMEGGSTSTSPGCLSGKHCESYTYTSGKMEVTKTGYNCVSDYGDNDDDDNSGGWQGGKW